MTLGTPREAIDRDSTADADSGLSIEIPASGLSPLAIVLLLIVLGVGLFLFLEGRRGTKFHQPLHHSLRESGLTPPPPQLELQQLSPGSSSDAKAAEAPVLEPTRKALASVVPPPITRPPPLMQGSSTQLFLHPVATSTEPPLVLDLSEPVPVPSGDDATAKATVLRNRSFLIPQGTLIAAALETPIDSTRAGLVRALTSGDTRGFDGTQVLIPRGSRLIGEYHSDIQVGQTRVVIIWNRVIRPDGVSIKLTSPGSDTVGGAGVAGEVNNHLFARLTNIVLQSALTLGVNVASNPGNGSVVIGPPAQAVTGNGQSLFPTQDLKPTIAVSEGASITVFVARDLDFSGTLPRS